MNKLAETSKLFSAVGIDLEQTIDASVRDSMRRSKKQMPYKTLIYKGTAHRKEKIGRNEPCPCNSGKKYKRCCLEDGKYEGYMEE